MNKKNLMVTALALSLSFGMGIASEYENWHGEDDHHFGHGKGGHQLPILLMDKNQDGAVDDAEKRAFFAPIFAKADKNQDGKLSGGEMREFHKLIKQSAHESMKNGLTLEQILKMPMGK